MTQRNLRALEEGDPGHRRSVIEKRLVGPRAKPTEPDWSVIFPTDGDELANARLRTSASAEWTAVVDSLHALGILSGRLDYRALMEYAICCARIDECERAISVMGVVIPGARDGMTVKNPYVTVVGQYRQQLRALLTHLGLSPHARAGLEKPSVTDDGGDSPWSD
jgi:P27 family predicted phage terminase small subunit